MAWGKYLNCALLLCKLLWILYLFFLLKFKVKKSDCLAFGEAVNAISAYNFSLGSMVGLGLFWLFKGRPCVCLVERASSILIQWSWNSIPLRFSSSFYTRWGKFKKANIFDILIYRYFNIPGLMSMLCSLCSFQYKQWWNSYL